MNVPQDERARRSEAADRQDAHYDPSERLLKKWLGDAYSYNWYARNTFAHATRDSLGYAVQLLDTYDDARIPRAGDAVRALDDPDRLTETLREEPVLVVQPGDRTPAIAPTDDRHPSSALRRQPGEPGDARCLPGAARDDVPDGDHPGRDGRGAPEAAIEERVADTGRAGIERGERLKRRG